MTVEKDIGRILVILIFILALIFFLNKHNNPNLPNNPIPQPISPIPDKPNPKPPEPQPIIVPGSQVKWFYFPPQRNDFTIKIPFLKDIVTHLPSSFGNKYYFKDEDTYGHECTHGIHAHLRNTFCKGKEVAFYVGENKAVIINQPKLTLGQIAQIIPPNLRGSRYSLYFVSQLRDWNNTPLYVFDEWVAYTNGATVALESPSKNHTDTMIAPMEFAIYSIFTCIAIDKYDSSYLQENTQYKEFVAHELQRAIGIYRKGIVLPQYKWDSQLPSIVQQNQDCINIINKMYGQNLTLNKLFND